MTMTYYGSIWFLFHPKTENMQRERERETSTHAHKKVGASHCEAPYWVRRGKRRCIVLQHCRFYENLQYASMIIINVPNIWSWIFLYNLLWSCLQVYAKEVHRSLLSRFLSLGSVGMTQCSAFLVAKLKPNRTVAGVKFCRKYKDKQLEIAF